MLKIWIDYFFLILLMNEVKGYIFGYVIDIKMWCYFIYWVGLINVGF